MKILLAFLILAVLGGSIYYYIYDDSKETIEIIGSVHVSVNNSKYVNTVEIQDQPYFAVIQGVARNKSKETLKSVLIKYNIAGENTSTIIFDLAPGQQVSFVTKSVLISEKKPEYFLDTIQFEKTSL
ncbi:MAG TPA: hypothetical protein VI362_08565 [Ignavibacteriaceae bacterium]|nr:hypothetical protein [Ignavibacteriaceae bacterium]